MVQWWTGLEGFRTGEDVAVTLEFDRVAVLGPSTAMDEARQAHNLAFLSSHLTDDLAERIERALRGLDTGG
jgi:hypothetical protein